MEGVLNGLQAAKINKITNKTFLIEFAPLSQ